MRDNKKILDVTYGTFSCRLEGFDDSVATMKQVAEFLSALGDQERLPDVSKNTIDIAALAELTGAQVEHDSTPGERTQLRLRHQPTSEAESADTAPDQPDGSDDDDDSVAARMDRIRAALGRVDEPIDEAADEKPVAPLRMTPLAQRLADLAQRKAALNDVVAQDDQARLLAALVDQEELDDDDDDDDDDQVELSAAHEEWTDEDDTWAMDDSDAEDDFEADPEQDFGGTSDTEHRPKKADLSPAADDTVLRILTQTDDEINAPALRHQRFSFAQLKAASVATDAARQLGDEGDDGSQMNVPYRDDLVDLAAHADRPADVDDLPSEDVSIDADDPVATEAEIDLADDSASDTDAVEEPMPPLVLSRPLNPSKLPPLRLIASQRVADPVRPVGTEQRLRQIVSRLDSSAKTRVSYADFVASYGVTDVAEMIVAAAAYVNFITASPDFSRPEVMRLVRNYAPEAVAREQGVRLFGRLVAENRITQLSNGRFRVGDDTPYRPASAALRR